MTFFVVFLQKIFRNLNLIFFSVEFLTLSLRAFRITSAFANFAPKYDCSNLCSYLDRTFFVVFQKNFQKT